MPKSKKKKQNTPAPTAFNPFKLPNYSNRKELEAAYSKIFTRSAEEAKKMRNDPTNGLSLDYLDLDPVRIRRRRKAALQYVDQVKQLISDICPEIPGAFYIEEEWAEINALFLPTYDMYEPDELLTYAAALWLLDRIQENGRMCELSEILPHDSLLLDDLDSPILYDPSYCSDIVNGVVWVIRNRNSDCTGLKVTEPAEGNVPRTYMDDYTAAGRQHQDVPSRQRFEKLLALAGRENLEHAAEHYEEMLWELVRLYFAYREPYTEEERGFADQRSRFTDMVLRNTNALQKEVSQRKSNVKPAKRAAPFTPLMKQPTPELFSSSRNLMERNATSKEDEFLLALMDMDREEEKLKKRYTQMLRSNATRCITFCEFINYSRDGLIKLMDENCAELLTGFDIGDPYEMSAALLWLIDTGSELPWLYFPGICLMSTIAGRLPWHKGFFDPTIDSWWNLGYSDDKFHLTENASRPKSLQLPDAPDWYGLNCIGKYDGGTDFERTNLAQIVYQITGAIIPRNTSRYDDAAIILKRFGVTGNRALTPLLPAISMLGTCTHQGTLVRRDAWAPDEPEPEVPAEDTEDPEIYKQTIRDLKQQIASLMQEQAAADLRPDRIP